MALTSLYVSRNWMPRSYSLHWNLHRTPMQATSNAAKEVMKPKEDIKVAEDYRRQHQARHSQARQAFASAQGKIMGSMLDHLGTFTEKPAEALELLQHSLDEAGHPPEEDPLSQKILIALCQRIEAAASLAKLDLRGGVSAGTVMGGSLHARQVPVLETDASILLVTATLFGMCNRVAKLIARTASISDVEQDGKNFVCVEYAPDDPQEAFDRDKDLLSDWRQTLLDFAVNLERPDLGRTYALTGLEQVLWGQALASMELFVVGHEYGHHLASHGVDIQDSNVIAFPEESYEMELEADRYGALLAGVASMSDSFPNMYAISCIGPLIVLTVLEYSYRGHSLLNTGKLPLVSTDPHPPLEERAEALRAAVPFFNGADASLPLLRVYDNTKKILDRVWIDVEKELLQQHRLRTRAPERGSDWLPR